MALQIRRGTDSQRQGITPKAGEPIFTTDTKKLYIGDGSTAGGIVVDTTGNQITDIIEDITPQLGGPLDLNNQNIVGTGNIAITGQISATSIDLKGSIFADDSTLLVDGISGRIVGPVHANVTGNVTGNTQRPAIVMKYVNRKTTEKKSRIGPAAPVNGTKVQTRGKVKVSNKISKLKSCVYITSDKCYKNDESGSHRV
mgnify:CR=1 FL=1